MKKNYMMCGESTQLTAREKRQRIHKWNQILADLRVADAAFKSNPSTQAGNTLRGLRNQLRLLCLHKYDYNLAKLKWSFYVQGGRPGRMLTKRVKQLQVRSKIPYFYSNKRYATLQHLFADYYQKLYNLETSESSSPISPTQIDSVLSQLSLPTLNMTQLDTLNEPVTLQEVNRVLKSSKLLKSPGPDGLPNEYYQTFLHILAPHYARRLLITNAPHQQRCFKQLSPPSLNRVNL